MPTSDVLVIIPVYQNYEQRDRCLAALARQTHAVDTFIHDNTTENIGYTRACNRGLRQALSKRHRFALVLNQDCYPEPDAIEKLVKIMDEHPRCAITGPMQVRAEAPDEIVNTGGLRAYPYGSHRGSGRRSAGQFARSEPVAWINGAAMFARMEAVSEFGLMDESMFLIGSDSDWCLTARMRGWETWYCADAVVLHEGGVSQRWPKEPVQRHFHSDMSYFRRKWVGTVMHRQLDRPVGEPRIVGSIAVAMQKAAADHSAGRFTDAEVVYRDVLDVDPQNVDALNLLGVIELNSGMPLIALDLFRRALAIRPDISRIHAHAGAALMLMARNDESLESFNEAVRLESQSPEMIEAVAGDLAKMGFASEAAAARAKANALRQR